MRLLAAIAAGFVFALGATGVAAKSVVPVGFVAVTTGSGSLQIASFRLDGSGERHLTRGPANHHLPSVSPGGTELLYTGDDEGMDEIYRLDLVGSSTPVEITRPPLQATSAGWAPDGRSIVYSALLPDAPAYQIFVANPDGSNAVQLTHTIDSGNSQPAFSPDGRRIAYINGREANGNRIWVMNADGSDANPLTPGPLDAYPAWLDGRTVVFARSEPLSGSSEVIGVGLDGREQVLSPAHQYFIEPKPLPGGKAYGATLQAGHMLRLVKISRLDGADLAASTPGEFVVDVLPIPPADGSSLTIGWILGFEQSPPAPVAAFATAAGGLLVLVLAAVAALRKTSAC